MRATEKRGAGIATRTTAWWAEPGRGRGRRPLILEQPELPARLLPPTPIERRRFDYGELEAAIAHAEQVTWQTRRALDALVRGNGGATGP